jgi:hypothetical protein
VDFATHNGKHHPVNEKAKLSKSNLHESESNHVSKSKLEKIKKKYDSSGDVTKFCKGCSKNFRENHNHGSGYCPKCRANASKQEYDKHEKIVGNWFDDLSKSDKIKIVGVGHITNYVNLTNREQSQVSIQYHRKHDDTKKKYYSNKSDFWKSLSRDKRKELLRKTHIRNEKEIDEYSKKQWKSLSDSNANSGASNISGYLNFAMNKYNEENSKN